MANVVITGLDELQEAFRAIGSIPWEITSKTLDEMGKTAAQKVQASGEAMGVRDPESGEHILDNVGHSKPYATAGGGKSWITIRGSRKRGNTVTRNAMIAYINEYGAPQRGIPARPFILRAMTEGENEIVEAAEKIIGGWIENTFGHG